MNKVSNEIKITTQYFDENKDIEIYKFGDLKVETDKNLLKYLKANRVNLNVNYDAIFEYYKQSQKKQNIEILKNNFMCEIPELLQLRSYIDNLDAHKLKEYSISQLYNPDVLHSIMCIINSIFYSKLDDTNNNIILKKYINNLQKINTESKMCNAFFCEFPRSI